MFLICSCYRFPDSCTFTESDGSTPRENRDYQSQRKDWSDKATICCSSEHSNTQKIWQVNSLHLFWHRTPGQARQCMCVWATAAVYSVYPIFQDFLWKSRFCMLRRGFTAKRLLTSSSLWCDEIDVNEIKQFLLLLALIGQIRLLFEELSLHIYWSDNSYGGYFN